ncbi:MAG: DUF1570 domain-containing protein, partial [Phycisphaerales bacterium]
MWKHAHGMLLAGAFTVTTALPALAWVSDDPPAKLTEMSEDEQGGYIRVTSPRTGELLVDHNVEDQLEQRSPSFDLARSLLPAGFIVTQTPRFVIFSDADAAWTQAQAGNLERTHLQFQRFCERLSLQPDALQHRLVCILFHDRDRYRAFAAEHDNVHMRIGGYYSPKHDWVVFYHPESNPSIVQAREQLAEMKREVDGLARTAERESARGSRNEAARVKSVLKVHREHYQGELERVERFVHQTSVATTLHEATHLLLFHTGIQDRDVTYPMWISEGLATCFETDRPDHAFGPDYEYAVRREGSDELLTKGARIPVRSLVSLNMLSSDEEQVGQAVYHQSYALLMWMMRFRPEDLAAYLALMQQQQPGWINGDTQCALFEQAFGPIEDLERAWLRHEASRQVTMTPAT